MSMAIIWVKEVNLHGPFKKCSCCFSCLDMHVSVYCLLNWHDWQEVTDGETADRKIKATLIFYLIRIRQQKPIISKYLPSPECFSPFD